MEVSVSNDRMDTLQKGMSIHRLNPNLLIGDLATEVEKYKEKYCIGLLTKIDPDLGEGEQVKEKRQVGNRKKKLVIFPCH